MADIDKWIDIAKECKYLPENDLKVTSSSYLSYRHAKDKQCMREYVCNLCNFIGQLIFYVSLSRINLDALYSFRNCAIWFVIFSWKSQIFSQFQLL